MPKVRLQTFAGRVHRVAAPAADLVYLGLPLLPPDCHPWTVHQCFEPNFAAVMSFSS